MPREGTPGHRSPQVKLRVVDDDDEPAPANFSADAPWDTDARNLPTRGWIYGGHYLTGTVSATVANGGTGKTILALAEAIAMTTGRDILGVGHDDGGRRVLFWSGEESRFEIMRRVFAACQHYGVDPRELMPNDSSDEFCLSGQGLFIASGLDSPLCIARAGPHGLAFDAAGAEALAEFIRENSIEVAIFDPFVTIHQVPENDNVAINAVVGVLKRIADDCRIALEIVHHTRKQVQGGGESTVGDARGASALVDAARSARVLNDMTEAEGRRAKVSNHRNYFRCDNGKANYMPPATGSQWFQKVPLTLPNRDPFDDSPNAIGDIVGVVVPWRFPQPFDNVTPDHMRRVRDMAREGEYRADPRSPDWIGHAVAEVLDLDPEDDKARIKAVLKAWLANGVFKVAKRKDETRRERSFVVPGAWAES